MTKLSAVVITFNEEKNIDRCLTSLKGVVDEIIVVDSYSSDSTESICKEHDVNFIQNPFKGHIEQKNFAMKKANYDYVLSLDADEALDDRLRDAILAEKQELSFDSYSFNRLTNYCGKWIRHCGWYPDTKTRLWNKHKGRWGGVNPHDKVTMDRGSSSKHLKGDLLHYSFYTVQQHLDQIEYFTDISSKAAHDNGKRSNYLKLLVKPMFKFLRDYILKLGILDGYYGFIICKNSTYAKYLKYKKLMTLQKRIDT
ncbi:MAG: glycosyltransferase family 2 protein [Flavobacteriales bacterium]|nr:glycosyltransferase family 2 protein [Flavobacteriales bacterium]